MQHETADYRYAPTGLMAEPWGKTGHRTAVAEFIVTAHLSERRYMDNDASRDALEYVWSPDDATVLAGRIFNSDEHREICRRLGSVNEWWVTLRCANAAYDRGLIDERELDRIADEV